MLKKGDLGFGVYKITDESILVNALETALKTGYTHIDTAAFYQNEKYIGDYLKTYPKKEDITVTTKIWVSDLSADKIEKAFERSYKFLDGKIDILLIHWPHPEKYLEAYEYLQSILEKKLVKKIGVSNFEIEHLENLKKHGLITPYLNQIELHPKLAQKDLRAYHKENGILTQAWSPIGKARYFDDEILIEIAKRNNMTVSQVILCWHIQNDIYAIPKSQTPSRIIENYNSKKFTLSKEDIEKINSLDCNLRLGKHPNKFPYEEYK